MEDKIFTEKKVEANIERSPNAEQTQPLIQGDAKGHFNYKHGDVLHDRFEILSTLGQGSFGRVVKIKDREEEQYKALKIAKNKQRYRKYAFMEISVLKEISKKDPNNESLCVKMFGWFEYNGHICIAIELLGISLYEFLRINDYQPYPMEHVRHIAHQLCHAVKFLHDNHLTHTDIKPDNILFVNSAYTFHLNAENTRVLRRIECTDIRLIDFGCATFEHQDHNKIVSTAPFRAPEVLLKLTWAHPCDVWSIGCTLYEIYSGKLLFKAKETLEHLAMMQRVLGPMPYLMARNHMLRYKNSTTYFTKGKLNWNEKSSEALKIRVACKPLSECQRSEGNQDESELLQLIKSMLEYEPERRINLGEALKHPFFAKLPAKQHIGEITKY